MNTPDDKRPHRRRRYLVIPRLQLRMMGWIFLIGIALLACVALAIGCYFISLTRAEIDQSGVTNEPGGAGLLCSCPLYLKIVLWIFIAILAWISFRITHKIAGPLYRFRRIVAAVSAGDLDIPEIRVRKRDEFKGLAADLNRMVESLHTRREKDREAARIILENLEKLDALPEEKKKELGITEPLEKIRTASSQLGGQTTEK